MRNVIERAAILARGGPLEFDLPITQLPQVVISADDEVAAPEFFTEPEMLRRERDNLLIVLEKTDWKIKGSDGAAELLGVKPTTLLSRIKKMGLKREGKPMSPTSTVCAHDGTNFDEFERPRNSGKWRNVQRRNQRS